MANLDPIYLINIGLECLVLLTISNFGIIILQFIMRLYMKLWVLLTPIMIFLELDTFGLNMHKEAIKDT